ncbi:MAG: YHS domain protein [Alphaproteobacteria bacterium PA4]|nr:MAG: YHS domain protein [Alphaproteobacteria bacterium PA4]
MSRLSPRLALLIALLAPVVAPVYPAIAIGWQGADANEPAISGYDPVSYASGKPLPGDPAIAHVWQGISWRFASAANRAAFIADPARYAPQFGGHCAWAASDGRLAKPDPTIWHIVDGKLYLNCSPAADAKWLADVPGNIARGNAFWATQVAK